MVKSGYKGNVPFVMHQFCQPGERWHGTFDHYLLSVSLEGGADYRLHDGTAEVRTGDLLWFAPGAWQDWTAIPADGWMVHYVITDLPPSLQNLLPPANLADGIGLVALPDSIRDSARDAFTEMSVWSGRRTTMSERLILNQLEYVLLLIRNTYPTVVVDDRIERARAFLHNRLESPTTLDDVASSACLSKSRLCALFTEAYGTSPLQYLEELRMERAAQLLLFTGQRVDDIAGSLCYNERKYFDKRFKRHWQVTPYRYRREA